MAAQPPPDAGVPQQAATATATKKSGGCLGRGCGGCLLVVDNTFATPCLCRPLELGADVVIESLTKMIGGHSDITLGVLNVADRLIDVVGRFTDGAVGPDDFPRFGNREVVLAEMKAFRLKVARDLGVIIDDQRHAVARRDFAQFPRQLYDFASWIIFRAQLQ